MILSKMNKENRRLSNKFLLLIIFWGGIWSVIFNLLFVDRELREDVLIEIYRYCLITIDILFSFFMFFIIWKKNGFFCYFVKRVNYNSKIKFFLLSLFGLLLLFAIFYIILYNFEDAFHNVENFKELTRRKQMGKAVFSFSFFGVWYLSSATLLFTYLFSDTAIIFCLIMRYFFDKNYRERYKIELNNLEKQIENG